jgi:hypothetical protein
MAEFPGVTAHAAEAMRRLLAMNVVFRREMAEGRRGALFIAAAMIETRAVLDAIDGRQTSLKQLIGVATPEWVSESGARRIMSELVAEGLVRTKTSTKDRRAVIVTPTAKLAAKSERRWGALR